MGRILLISADKDFLELVRLSFEERVGCEVICSNNEHDAIHQLNKRSDFNAIIYEYSGSCGSSVDLVQFKISRHLVMPLLLFTDDPTPEIPYRTNSFVGVFRKNQIEHLYVSLELLFKKKRKI